MRANGVEAAIARYRETGTKMGSAYLGVLLYRRSWPKVNLQLHKIRNFYNTFSNFQKIRRYSILYLNSDDHKRAM